MGKPRKHGSLRIASSTLRTVPHVLLVALASSAHAQWTQFGGPDQDFKVADGGIAEKWPVEGPRTIWTRKLGEGYSGILADKDRLYTMYRDGKNEVVISLDAETGKTLWEYKYKSVPLKGIDPEQGKGPNATPLLADGRVYTTSIAGLLHCLDARNGKVLWSHNLWTGYKGKLTEFGYSSSPIRYKNMVIAFMGGDGQSIAAFDRKDGHLVWKGLTFPLSYGTPKLMTLCGQDQLVVCPADTVIGVDPNTGKMLWRYPVENQEKQNIAMPTRLDDDELFFSTYGRGSRRLRIVKNDKLSRDPSPPGGRGQGEGGSHGDSDPPPTPPWKGGEVRDGSSGFRVQEIWSSRQPQFSWVSFVRTGDHIYGSSGDHTSSYMAAVNVQTGKLAWRTRDFDLANVVGVGRRLIILDQKGYLGLATPSAKGLEVHSKITLLRQWSRTAPTVVGNVLYLRDFHNIMALDLR